MNTEEQARFDELYRQTSDFRRIISDCEARLVEHNRAMQEIINGAMAREHDSRPPSRMEGRLNNGRGSARQVPA